MTEGLKKKAACWDSHGNLRNQPKKKERRRRGAALEKITLVELRHARAGGEHPREREDSGKQGEGTGLGMTSTVKPA